MRRVVIDVGVRPTITTELFVVPLEGAFLVYAPLRRAAFVANATVVNLIADLRDGIAPRDDSAEELVEFLRHLGLVDGPADLPPIRHSSGTPQPTMVTLFLTTACNLRCTYCYAAAGDAPGRAMPLSVARHGIDFILRNARALSRDEIEVAFHGGGEPTVNWATLTAAWEYAQTQAAPWGIRVASTLATNGVLSDAKIDWIVSHLTGASVSCDGLPAVHDAHRLTVHGGESSAAVLRTLGRFDEAGFPYSLRLTVTHDQISQLPASVAFLCERFHPRAIQAEPAYQLGRWEEAPSAETQAFLESFRDARAVAARQGHSLSFSGARLGLLTNHFCGVSQDSFSLTADGNVSACYEVFLETLPRAERFLYGRFDADEQQFRFELPVLNNLRRQTVDQHPFCDGCFAKWSCGGDCYHKAMAVNGTPEFKGTDRCHLIRELTQDQILDRIERSGGVFWNEGPV